MPLHIGVDAWNLTGDRRGIGRYVREILHTWAGWQPDHVALTLLVPERAPWFSRKRYLKELGGADMAVRHRGAARTLDVVWYPWNGMSWVAGVTSVASLHDASLFALPPPDPRIAEKEQRPLRLAAALAQLIITNSEFSKEELVRYLPLDPSRVEVIPLGVKEIFARVRSGDRVAPGRPYLLFVGEPESRKGVATLLQAMLLLPAELRASTELIVAGATGQYRLPPVPDSVMMRDVGWVADETLAGLYADASAFVYPSEYEGFGLPVVEAMAAGTPVIASDTRGLREAGGQAALFVAPGDPQALAAAITRVLTDRAVAADLVARGVARARQLTWEETARHTLAVLERAAVEASAGEASRPT
jgi:glycosyltransferase involved in cell wall biosynthesis